MVHKLAGTSTDSRNQLSERLSFLLVSCLLLDIRRAQAEHRLQVLQISPYLADAWPLTPLFMNRSRIAMRNGSSSESAQDTDRDPSVSLKQSGLVPGELIMKDVLISPDSQCEDL